MNSSHKHSVFGFLQCLGLVYIGRVKVLFKAVKSKQGSVKHTFLPSAPLNAKGERRDERIFRLLPLWYPRSATTSCHSWRGRWLDDCLSVAFPGASALFFMISYWRCLPPLPLYLCPLLIDDWSTFSAGDIGWFEDVGSTAPSAIGQRLGNRLIGRRWVVGPRLVGALVCLYACDSIGRSW